MMRLSCAALVALALGGVVNAQYVSSSISNNVEDLTTSGNLALDTGDDTGVIVPLDFDFSFYGNSITDIAVTTNGYLTTGASLSDFSNECIGTAGNPNALVAPLWDDFTLNVMNGSIWTQTVGVPGDRTFLVQWEDVAAFSNSNASYTFQTKLFEADDSIEFHYGILNGPLSATIGIENESGTAGVEIGCDVSSAGATGHRFELETVASPVLDAPYSACIGDYVPLSGTGEPGHFYAIAVSASTGPTPVLPGLMVDLGPDWADNVVGMGMIDGTGATAVHSPFAPDTIPCGATVHAQMVTIGSFDPITGVQNSAPTETIFEEKQIFIGELEFLAITSDLYSVHASAGDVLTVTLCRLPSLPDGTSFLDPRLCIYQDAMGGPFGGLGIASDDDSLGDCFVTGPGGAAIIENWVVPADGTYTIAASAWPLTHGPYEMVVSGCSGAVSLIGDEVLGGCFTP